MRRTTQCSESPGKMTPSRYLVQCGDCDVSASAHSSEWEPDWVSKEHTPSKEPKEPEGA